MSEERSWGRAMCGTNWTKFDIKLDAQCEAGVLRWGLH